MTLLFQHTGEGAADELDVAIGDNGYGSPFTLVQKSSGFTIKYDTARSAHGLCSIRMTRTATTDNGFVKVILTQSVGRLQASIYVYLTALPDTGLDLLVFRSGSGFMGYMSIGFGIGGAVDGKLVFRNAAGAAISGSRAANAFPLNAWVRIDTAIKKGTGTTDGTFEYGYYLGDAASPVETPFSSTAENTGTADPVEVRAGLNGATVNPASIWIDDLRIGDGTTGFLGPVSATVTGVITPASADPGVERTLTLTMYNGNGQPITWGSDGGANTGGIDWGDGKAKDAPVTTAAGVNSKTFKRTPTASGLGRGWSAPWSQAA